MTPHTDTDWLEVLYGEMYEAWGLYENQGAEFEQCFERAKTAIANILASEVLEARKDQIMIDELAFTTGTDENESLMIEIRNELLAQLRASTTQSKEP